MLVDENRLLVRSEYLATSERSGNKSRELTALMNRTV
jgi:hypothetical protein